jgi:hypothetical protein
MCSLFISKLMHRVKRSKESKILEVQAELHYRNRKLCKAMKYLKTKLSCRSSSSSSSSSLPPSSSSLPSSSSDITSGQAHKIFHKVVDGAYQTNTIKSNRKHHRQSTPFQHHHDHHPLPLPRPSSSSSLLPQHDFKYRRDLPSMIKAAIFRRRRMTFQALQQWRTKVSETMRVRYKVDRFIAERYVVGGRGWGVYL